MEEQHESKPSSSLSSPARFGGAKKEEEEQKLSHKSEEKAKARESYSPFFGKHRMAASITHLQNQINILQVLLIIHLIYLYILLCSFIGFCEVQLA